MSHSERASNDFKEGDNGELEFKRERERESECERVIVLIFNDAIEG